ncbi:MAG TPA: HNH endonuclease signature motif containing protein [Verrucomicrobiae bacterium]|nr:HNH endonuclease signature motif containing protein [Verrucomicrobiae bacterium]
MFLILCLSGVAALKLYNKKKPDERKYFPQHIKENIIRKQDHKCAHCKKLLNVIDWDHKNGNRANNKESNCQALCPNCHAIKTRRGYSKI